ncbi:hypothetical protein PssB301D_04187 [Pseudomonas syringae pv. syringae str. B301D-R]|uniref:Uncharacterized protein n=1 Tax=Pseudomonas avellanae TaxID=46257 RepID=A0A3M5TZW0_9PSED|nr:hypothetical protein PsyrB_01135 [Pseudomonas syringae pv. syringae B301D]EXL29600.1 hypothetical protein PssB301D_04187 [Pseudomonas syringae pv. syringae str. B301D-R]RMU39130.1 hypothetical protein ALP32_200162 [Pseudomonas avellanae]
MTFFELWLKSSLGSPVTASTLLQLDTAQDIMAR